MINDLVLPEGWRVEPLSSCADVLDSRRKPVNSGERAKRVGGVPYYGATGRVGWIDDHLFDEELVLLGEDGAPFFDKSKPIAYIVDGKSWVNNHAHVLRARPQLTTNRYLKYYFDAFDFTHFVGGSTRDKLTQTAMKSIPIALAPRHEQDALVAIIDEAIDRRGYALTRLDAARRAIGRLRQAVLASACSGQLTAYWRESHVPLRPADELIELSRSAVLAASTRRSQPQPWAEPDWLELPDSWRWAPMRDLALIKGGIQKQPKRAPRDNPYPYLRVANVLRGRLDLEQIHEFELFGEELEAYRLAEGDLLVVEGNGSPTEIGRAALWQGEIDNCVHQNHIIRVRSVGMDAEFAALFWNSPVGAREIASLAVTSAGLYSLSTKKIGAVPVPVPPLEEQQEIVRRAQALLASADGLQQRVAAAAKHVERSAQAILAKGFRGDLVGQTSRGF